MLFNPFNTSKIKSDYARNVADAMDAFAVSCSLTNIPIIIGYTFENNSHDFYIYRHANAEDKSHHKWRYSVHINIVEKRKVNKITVIVYERYIGGYLEPRTTLSKFNYECVPIQHSRSDCEKVTYYFYINTIEDLSEILNEVAKHL